MLKEIPVHLEIAVDNLLSGTASPEERKAILDWYYANFPDVEMVQTDEPESVLFERILTNISHEINAADTRKPLMRFRMSRAIQIAAMVVVLLSSAALFVWQARKPATGSAKNITAKNNVATTDIPPGGKKATLTLSDGSIILLDSAAKGFLRTEGSADISLTNDGAIAYQQKDSKLEKRGSPSPVLNTLSIPRGGEFMLLLPDGTKVWVNAASMLRFPNFFSGPTREVELTGEAYFEVAKNEKMPFHVKAGQTDIAVLGTSFNVSAYETDKNIQTTLLNGKVRVSLNSTGANSAAKPVILQPGQQAASAAGISVSRVDTSAVVAWKNGNFQFHENTLPEVMNQLSRWYNIEFSFQDGVVPPLLLVGRYSRQRTLSEALTLLTDMGVRYTLKGNTLTILH